MSDIKGLIKIKQYIDEDKEYLNIENYKIYYDSISGEYKCNFKCPTCNKSLGCFCFESIENAIYSIDEGCSFYCNRHWLELEFEDSFPEMCGMVDELTGINTTKLGDIFNGYMYNEICPSADLRYKAERMDEIIKSAMELIKSLTDDQVSAVTDKMECGFDDFSGSVCNT